MEQCSPFGWVYFNEEEGMMGEVKQYILQSRMELEATVMAAQEEIMKKEEELLHMKDLLLLTIKERDEAQAKLQKLTLEKLLLQQQLQQQQQQQQPPRQQQQQQQKAASLTNTNTTTNCFSTSSSESEESSIISSPRCGTGSGGIDNFPTAALQQPRQPGQSLQLPPQIAAKLASSRRPLPEKGRLLKAVMEAGPLLQTLLLAGPLPQWQHPPPQLESIEIPPVTINPSNSPRKRGMDNFDCPFISSPKYQRVV